MVFVILLGSRALHGQVLVRDSNAARVLHPASSARRVPGQDIVDVLRRWFGYKPSSKTDTIRLGDKPVLSVLPAVGYTLQTRLAAIVAGNLAFFTSQHPHARLSVFTASPTYTQNRQFTIPVQSNIWLRGDEFNLLGDWRYMKYPQSTYGLGSDAPIENRDPMNYKYIRFYQYGLRKMGDDLYAGIGYNLDYHWDISESGLADSSASDYAGYGTSEKSTSSGFSVIAVYDSRPNPINATGGLLASVVWRDNVRWLGSHSHWQSLVTDVRKYLTLPAGSRNVLAFWNYNWIILQGKPPYLDLPSTGWDNFNNTGRGFIQGRYRGNIMVYLETEYRFRLTASGLLGAVVFANAESFSAAPSRQLESLQPAVGAGLRIKLNKKSNTNIAIDYGVGTQGSRGLFVNVGEVF
ncbi:MAG TPA: hypothetical protein VG870_11660 [Chitinophagaceae bacterium]|nr:hypothetical protein [Chitinophagaceae bacterium]